MAAITRNPENQDFSSAYKFVAVLLGFGILGFTVLACLAISFSFQTGGGSVGILAFAAVAVFALICPMILFIGWIIYMLSSGKTKASPVDLATVEQTTSAASFLVLDKQVFMAPQKYAQLSRKSGLSKHFNTVKYFLIDAQGNKYSVDREMYKQVGIGDEVKVSYHVQRSLNYVTSLDIVKSKNNSPMPETELESAESAAANKATWDFAKPAIIILLVLGGCICVQVIISAIFAGLSIA